MDDIEGRLLTEAIHRREDFYSLHLAVDEIDKLINDIPITLPNEKALRQSMLILKTGFQNEKKTK